MLNKILAGVVTYNPDIIRLKENINALSKQVNNILIIDNGSTNYSAICESFLEKVTFIRNETNLGIAEALCQIMIYAKDNNYSWVITLDQDSVINPGLVSEYIIASEREDCKDVGMFTCLIKDRNFSDSRYENQNDTVIEVPYCITSASFTNVEKYFDTSGYDKSFFIDAVDFDICYSLRELGYKVCRINYIGLYHEVGHGENRRFLWKKLVVYHQKPFRIYYLARNTIRMNAKHKKLFPWYVMVKKELALFMKIVLYEDNRGEKIKSFFKGIKDS